MKTYLSSKIVKAEPMTESTFMSQFRNADIVEGGKEGDRSGYHVEYPDNYHSWSPSPAFEDSHREVLASEIKLINQDQNVGYKTLNEEEAIDEGKGANVQTDDREPKEQA